MSSTTASPSAPATFRERVKEVCRMARGGLWVSSSEVLDAIDDIGMLINDVDMKFSVTIWDCVQGSRDASGEPEMPSDDPFAQSGGESAYAALQAFLHQIETRNEMQDDALIQAGYNILVLRNGHREIVNNSQTDRKTLTAMQIAIEKARSVGCLLVIVAHSSASVPPELKELLWRVDHDLPDYDERCRVVSEIATGGSVTRPGKKEIEHISRLTGGLTRGQLEGVISLSYIRHRKACPDEVSLQKAKIINDSGLLRLHPPSGGFETLGGLSGIKKFLTRAMRPDKPADAMARGVLLLGVPGAGKSHIAKALGAEVGRPTLSLDIGSLMGGIVGETEEKTRQALDIIDSVAPAVVFIDKFCRLMA